MDLSPQQVMTKEDLIDTNATTARRRKHRLATGAIGILLAGGIAGGALTVASATTMTTAATSPSATAGSPSETSWHLRPGSGAAGGGGSNGRSGPASGGAPDTVRSVSTFSFTMSTSACQKVTVDEASSATYQKETILTSAREMTKGESVLVLGTTSGTTITATQVIVKPTGGPGPRGLGPFCYVEVIPRMVIRAVSLQSRAVGTSVTTATPWRRRPMPGALRRRSGVG